jgi:mRNA-degrading endonuclease RelE of RelBE toxin-antitoxin system
MFQIIFTPVSSAEMTALPKLLQLEILDEFQAFSPDYMEKNPDKFGLISQGGRSLYRFRATDYRIYFEKREEGLLVHRVLNKNSLKDFFYRSQLPVAEDEELQKNPNFWAMIDDSAGQNKK